MEVSGFHGNNSYLAIWGRGLKEKFDHMQIYIYSHTFLVTPQPSFVNV